MNERIKNILCRLKISTDGAGLKPINIKQKHKHLFPKINGFNPTSVKCNTCDVIKVYIPGRTIMMNDLSVEVLRNNV